jgi:hypothetical protein
MKISRKASVTAFSACSAGVLFFMLQMAQAQSTYDITLQCSQARQSAYNSVKASILAQKSQCGQQTGLSYATCAANIDAIAEREATKAGTDAEEQCLYKAYGGQ